MDVDSRATLTYLPSLPLDLKSPSLNGSDLGSLLIFFDEGSVTRGFDYLSTRRSNTLLSAAYLFQLLLQQQW